MYQTKQTVKQNKTKVTRDEERHLIMTKGAVRQEDITIINKYVPKNRDPKYIKENLTEWRNRKFNNNSHSLQYHTFNNGQKNQANDNEGNRRLE